MIEHGRWDERFVCKVKEERREEVQAVSGNGFERASNHYMISVHRAPVGKVYSSITHTHTHTLPW